MLKLNICREFGIQPSEYDQMDSREVQVAVEMINAEANEQKRQAKKAKKGTVNN